MQALKHEVMQMLGIALSEAQLTAFELYSRELIEWNQRFNLTSITDPEQVRIKHILDLLSCWLAMRNEPLGKVIDLGTGAGFPGLALKILQPEMQLTLVEATAKKASFLEHMVQVLRLGGVEVLARRGEEVGQMADQREAYDWALARALAPMPVLSEYLLPVVKVGGYALAQKGRDAKAELDAAGAAIKTLGGEASQMLAADVPNLGEERWLLILKKVAKTPAAYPRRPGMPSKRPLA